MHICAFFASLGIMDTEAVWLASAAATVPCVMLDLAAGAIERHQRRVAGVAIEAMNPFGQFILSLVANALGCAAFCFFYAFLWAGSGRAFIYGGIIWLFVAIPMLLMTNYMGEVQVKTLSTRILAWLFKAAAASISLAYFVG